MLDGQPDQVDESDYGVIAYKTKLPYSGTLKALVQPFLTGNESSVEHHGHYVHYTKKSPAGTVQVFDFKRYLNGSCGDFFESSELENHPL